MVVMSLAYSLSAYPIGKLSDRLDRRLLLALGMALLSAADLLLGMGQSVMSVFVGVAVWGLHMGFTTGHSRRDGVRNGSFDPARHGVRRVQPGLRPGVLLASALAGWLWDHFGASTTFWQVRRSSWCRCYYVGTRRGRAALRAG